MNAPAGLVWATLNLDRENGTALQRQLYDQVRDAIVRGDVLPGSRFPSSRVLAAEIGCSRNTVVEVLSRLMAEGYLASVRRSGTFVAQDIPDRAMQARAHTLAERTDTESTAAPALSSRGSALAATRIANAGDLTQPFMPSVPDVTLFPLATWNALARHTWHEEGDALVREIDVRGYAPLRRAIAAYVRVARGIACDPDQILVLSGAQQGIDVLARVLVDPGDTVWVEDPGYPPLRGLFASAGARVVGVPVDANGLDFERHEAPVPRVIAVAPSNQFPLGVMMSLDRRIALLDYAARHGAWIVEDDFDSEFRYEGPPVAALASLSDDAAQRVIYVGTFSKMLFPAVRLGFAIVPRLLAREFARARRALDLQPSIAAQPALARFLTEGHLAAHVRRMRQIYRARRDALLEAVLADADDLLICDKPQAGMQLIARFTPALAARMDAPEAARLASARGVWVQPLSMYSMRPECPQAFVLGYACAAEPALRAAVADLAHALRGSAATGVA